MKIVSYNICRGGFDNYNQISSKPERLDLLQKAVGIIGADFIGLVDTFRWKEIFNDQNLTKIFNYKNAYHINMNDIRVDEKIGLTILSNFPFMNIEVIRLKSRNCIKAEIKYRDRKLNVFTVYFDDLSEDTRLEQAKVLLENTPIESTIIMGDLNCIYQEEIPKLENHLKKFLQENPTFSQQKDFNTYFVPAFEEIKKGKVISLIRAKGFIDARGKKVRQPTAFTRLSIPTLGPILTVDHIFCSQDIQTKDFQVLTAGVFEKASDHFPVVTEII